MQSPRKKTNIQMSSRKKIVLSDEEVNNEEINRNRKMGIRQTKSKGKSLVSTCEEDDYSDSDDVCVVGEVSAFTKYPRGAVLGIHRPHEFTCTSSHIKRRKRPESSNGLRSITIRRTPVGISSSNLRNSSAIKRLFQMEESIRLEERRSYVELIKKILGVSLIIGAETIRKCLYPGSLSRNLVASQPLTCNLSRESIHKTKPKDLPKPPVEFVDLTCDDSDSDIVEVPQVSPPSDHDDLEELPSGSGGDEIIDLEEEFGNSGRSSASSVLLEDSDGAAPISTTNQLEILNVDDDDDEENDECINLEEEAEDEERKEKGKRKSTDFRCKNKPNRNLEDQMLHQMHLDDRSVINVELKEEDDDLEEESLPEITHEMQILVLKAFSNKSNKVLVDAFGLEIRPKDIHTLKGSNWLNDQVINFYMSLIMERGKLSSYPSVYCFNTFFYVKLMTSGQNSLTRWTRKIDIFSYDLLIVPIHLKVHWCLACINFIEKRIEYYDSMGGENEECGKALLKYLEDEHFDKKNEYFNISGWEIVTMKDIPEQLNGSDCGVFLCTYAEYICRLAKLAFVQRDMPYFRAKMAYEILTSKLLL